MKKFVGKISISVLVLLFISGYSFSQHDPFLHNKIQRKIKTELELLYEKNELMKNYEKRNKQISKNQIILLIFTYLAGSVLTVVGICYGFIDIRVTNNISEFLISSSYLILLVGFWLLAYYKCLSEEYKTGGIFELMSMLI